MQLLNFLEGIVLGFCLLDTDNALCSMSWVFSGFYFVPHCAIIVQSKSSMARSLPVENLLPQNVGSIINCLQ